MIPTWDCKGHYINHICMCVLIFLKFHSNFYSFKFFLLLGFVSIESFSRINNYTTLHCKIFLNIHHLSMASFSFEKGKDVQSVFLVFDKEKLLLSVHSTISNTPKEKHWFMQSNIHCNVKYQFLKTGIPFLIDLVFTEVNQYIRKSQNW